MDSPIPRGFVTVEVMQIEKKAIAYRNNVAWCEIHCLPTFECNER